jgi:hypothetical protein
LEVVGDGFKGDLRRLLGEGHGNKRRESKERKGGKGSGIHGWSFFQILTEVFVGKGRWMATVEKTKAGPGSLEAPPNPALRDMRTGELTLTVA